MSEQSVGSHSGGGIADWYEHHPVLNVIATIASAVIVILITTAFVIFLMGD